MKQKDRIHLFLYLNLPLLISARYLLNDGVTKTFLKNIVYLEIVLIIFLIPDIIKQRLKISKNIRNFSQLYKQNLLISIIYFLFLTVLTLRFLFNTKESIYLGKIIFVVGALVLAFQIFTFVLVFFNSYINEKYTFSKLNIQKTIYKPVIYTLITLIPIFRFCIVNREILSIAELVILVLYFFSLSFVLIVLVSYVFDETLGTPIYQPFSTALLCIVYEMPSISKDYEVGAPMGSYYLLVIFLALFVFFRLVYKSKLIQMVLLTIGLYFGGTMESLTTEEEVDYELESVQASSPFVFNNEIKIEDKYSVLLLVYDGYPPEETLNMMGIDISNQTDYLINEGFTIYDGIYSMGSFSLGTMSRFLEGSEQEYSEDNMRKITGGNSSFAKTLDQYGYETAGIFTSVFYFPPNSSRAYDYSFPNEGGKRSKKMFTSILRGKLTFKDILYTIPYENYVSEKQYFLKDVANKEVPTFLYTHTYYPGHSQNSGICLEDETSTWKKRLNFANNEMREDISSLVPSFDNTIIVIMGDHGPFLTKNCTTLEGYDQEEIDRLDIQDRHGTFLAIRWPETSTPIEFENKVLQNVLISIFSTLTSDEQFMKQNELPERIHVTHLPKEILVENNIIYGGKNNLEPLFLNREIRKANK